VTAEPRRPSTGRLAKALSSSFEPSTPITLDLLDSIAHPLPEHHRLPSSFQSSHNFLDPFEGQTDDDRLRDALEANRADARVAGPTTTPDPIRHPPNVF
jgi:hypothetical protein